MRAISLLVVLVACGGRQTGPTTPGTDEVRSMEEMRITAHQEADGSISMNAYDAETLFNSGVAQMRAGSCEAAVQAFDRVADEFPTSRFVSPALYNGGLCLKQRQSNREAVLRFERILRDTPDSRDVKDAGFQMAELYVPLERWEDGLEHVDRMLERTDLNSDERVELLARKAQYYLGAERFEQARSQARLTLRWARTRPDGEQVRDPYFTAAASYVLAETLRREAAEVRIPEGNVATQRPILEQRAQLILDAQREYFNTMRSRNAEWSAAAGYRIGNMYDAFWDAIMTAPVPPPSEPLEGELLELYHDEYRTSLARLVKPLIRHSIRYWELTLQMVERTGVESEWTTRIEEDLERARTRLLEQPEGRGGLQPRTPESPPTTE